MRSLATISRLAAASEGPSVPLRPYISRTFPLARRGRSAMVVTWLDATSAAGGNRTPPPRRSGDLLQPGEDLPGVADVVGVVEDLVEVEPRPAVVGGEQVAQGYALVPCPLGQLLDEAVGLVAGGSCRDEGQEHPLGEEGAVGQLEVRAHALRIDGHAPHEVDGPVLEVVDEDGRVRQDHALDGGVGDVALVPEGDILEGRLGVSAQHAGEAGDLLALDRIALVGHRGGPLLAGAKRLLRLPHLLALLVTDLDREALEPG